MAEEEQAWIQTFGVGAASGWTEKAAPKRPLGFAPPKPVVIMPQSYRKKGKG